MDKDTKIMLKKVLIYDCLILAAVLIGSLMFFENYTVIVSIGLAMAGLNFILNAVITTYTLRAGGNKAYYIIGAMVRIFLTVGVAVLLAENNINNLVAFLIGYSLHYLAVLFYGATRGKNTERK